MKRIYFLFFVFFFFIQVKSIQNGTVYFDHDQFSFKGGIIDTQNGIAWGIFNDEVEVDGWGKLEIYSSSSSYFSDYHKSYAMGYIEGILTKTRIQQYFNNFFNYNFPNGFDPKLIAFLNENINWMNQKLKENPQTPYWKSVSYVVNQVQGIYDGMSLDHGTNLSFIDIWIMNVEGDVEDIIEVLNITTAHFKDRFSLDHCSGLVKLLEDGSDIYMSQVTWNRWYSMLRFLKYYHYGYTETPTEDVTFSGYPGIIVSLDDWYTLNKQFIITETTMIMNNPALYKYVNTSLLLTTVRTVLCSHLATSAENWATCFAKYSSGTYNNEWIILDYSLWSPGTKVLQPKTIYCLAQVPGTVLYRDISVNLTEDTYVASYNIPRFPEIFDLAGYPELVQQYGSWFDFNEHPRAKIFARDQGKVTDMSTMQHLMRYNGYPNDPLCDDCPGNAISSRKDLIDPNKPPINPYLLASCFGGEDAKIGTYSSIQDYSVYAEMGPTHDQQPVFSWSTAPDVCKGVPHEVIFFIILFPNFIFSQSEFSEILNQKFLLIPPIYNLENWEGENFKVEQNKIDLSTSETILSSIWTKNVF
ncbi:phospholipase b-related [Anaeramoeba ignava]|uniref:Phospholipase B-like n=1 Tax=Anaeramoeba ignava TaxID=1746090 RepID=A0A9Q0LWQ3_ANAIG|nr:phospholipase b-related [Anaeramoeba ignava]